MRFFDVTGMVGRVLAGVLGGFVLLNVLGECFRPGFDANIWWVDLRPVPAWLGVAVLVVTGVTLLIFSFGSVMDKKRARLARFLIAALFAMCIFNAMTYYKLLARGMFRTSMPVPLSLPIAGALAWIFFAIRSAPQAKPLRGRVILGLIVTGVVLLFAPLAQMFCFGKTDYRRSADAIVVFGAGVYANGKCSDALADRMRTAISLYQDGYADKLIFSGGPGMGKVHETDAMRQMGIDCGVPLEAIELDPYGLNTSETVKNTTRIFKTRRYRRILAVSHFYHLPRIKMSYQRAGWEVYTVPAKESYLLTQMPYFIAREVAALWKYYILP